MSDDCDPSVFSEEFKPLDVFNALLSSAFPIPSDVELAPGQYPTYEEDHHELYLIENVEKRPVLWDRYNLRYRDAETKRETWEEVASIVSGGTGPELERRFRLLRDRYVRIRKNYMKTGQIIQPADKWYYFFHRMTFLDSMIEHRTRNYDEDSPIPVKPTSKSTKCLKFSPLTKMKKKKSPPCMQVENSIDAIDYNSVAECLVEDDQNRPAAPSPLNNHTARSLSSVATEYLDPPNTSSTDCSTTPKNEPESDTNDDVVFKEKPKKRKADDDENDEESEVDLFVRSLKKSLRTMDARTFSLARVEIARVIFECQYGSR